MLCWQLALVLALAAHVGSAGDTLVLYEDEDIKQSHSLFFAALTGKGDLCVIEFGVSFAVFCSAVSDGQVSLRWQHVRDPALKQLNLQESNVTGVLLLAPSVNGV
jgi:hypothetical protein